MSSENGKISVIDLQKKGVLLVEDGNHGEYRPLKNEFCEIGTAFIRAADLGDGKISFSSAEKINTDATLRIRKGVGKAGDVLISHKGTLGKIGFAREGSPPFVCSPQTTFWRVLNEQVIDRYYLFAYMRSPQFKRVFSVCGGETDMAPYVSLTSQRSIELRLPQIRIQRAIGEIVHSLDDKIELNRKTNETLEAMAKALFNSWFVDFDPVRAKAEGRPTGLPAEISDLFPDSFEDSELGEIPCGWRVGSLDQIGINPRETAKPGEMNSSDRYIGLEHMPRESICLGESGQAEDLESNKNRFKQGDLLFGKLRPYFKKTGYAQFDGVCSTDIVVVRKKGEYGVGFICCFLASDPFIDFTVAASSGTRMPRSSWKDMCEFPFAIPSKILLREFDNQFCSTINKVTFNCILSASLAALRDALLPKLISGELRIPDAEKLLAEVGI